jgi:5-methylcytosine-specific restriction protein A
MTDLKHYKRPLKRCNEVGCDEKVSDNKYSKCDAHRRDVYKSFNAHKDSEPWRGRKYWQQIRKVVITRDVICQTCKANGKVVPGCDVDHIVPVSEGGSKYNLDNLQLLCRSCHSQKTMNEINSRG